MITRTATACRHYRTGAFFSLEADDEGFTLQTPAAAAETDLFIAPALVDIQVNGYKHVEFSSDTVTPEEVKSVFAAMAAVGVPYCCPTVTTSAPETMLHGLRTIEAACARWPEVAKANVGYHLEGPWIASEDGPRGAHPQAWTRDPDWEEFARMQEAAGGKVKIVSLAPERDGALPFIERLAAQGIVVALGHCGPTAEQVTAAVDAGARLSTHLGNGAHAVLPRHPNYLWDQLAEDRLYASIIADGFHLPPALVQVMVRAKGPQRIVLISDLFAYSGLAPGRYRLDDHRVVEVAANGRIGLYGTPFLSGANAPVTACVDNTVRFAGVELADAIDMASVNVWRLFGADPPVIAPGAKAAGLMLYRQREGTLDVVHTL